jgi:hypothetical protein
MLNDVTPVFEAALADYSDMVSLEIAEQTNGLVLYYLEMDACDVGDSFPERIEDLVSKLGLLTIGGFKVSIVTDSMSGDGDVDYFGGPTPDVTEAFEAEHKVDEILRSLGQRERILLLERLQAKPV